MKYLANLLDRALYDYHIPIDDIARIIDVSIPTISRWSTNQTEPHSAIYPSIVKLTEGLLENYLD